MSCIDVPVSETVLLTGSGFTNNFGGPLASDMCEIIIRRLDDLLHNNSLLEENNRTDLKNLIDLAKNELDYEKIFEEVMKGNKYSPNEKEIISNIFFESYKSLDKKVVSKGFLHGGNTVKFNRYNLHNFIEGLSPNRREKGFFFTLNQDIIIERYFRTAVITPCIDRINDPDDHLRQLDFKKNDWSRQVPNKEELVKRKLDKEGKWKNEKVFYIKLHGSFNWKDSSGNHTMVIGTSKLKDIEKEPILKWYIEMFKCVLSKPNRRLLIIGYGFRDKHINSVILNSIKKNNGLRLYLIYPKRIEDFQKETLKAMNSNNRKAIREATCRYYSDPLEYIFNHDNTPPDEYYELQKYFLGKQINY